MGEEHSQKDPNKFFEINFYLGCWVLFVFFLEEEYKKKKMSIGSSFVSLFCFFFGGGKRERGGDCTTHSKEPKNACHRSKIVFSLNFKKMGSGQRNKEQ